MGKADFDWKRDFRGFVGKEIVLSIGLPPAHFEKLRDPFKKYFMDAARYGLDFKYNDKSFNFHINMVGEIIKTGFCNTGNKTPSFFCNLY